MDLSKIVFWGMTTGGVAILGMLGFFIKQVFIRIDKMITQLSLLNANMTGQKVEIKSQAKRIDVAENRLNDHGERIRNIEIKQG